MIRLICTISLRRNRDQYIGLELAIDNYATHAFTRSRFIYVHTSCLAFRPRHVGPFGWMLLPCLAVTWFRVRRLTSHITSSCCAAVPCWRSNFEPQPHASPKSGPSLGLTHGALEPLVCLLDLPVFLIQPSNLNLNGTNHE